MRRHTQAEMITRCSPPLVRLAHEDERRAGDDRGAGADEGDVGVLDLARAGAAGGLQGAFDDVPEAVDAAGAEAAAEGVERQFAIGFDAAVLDEVERLAVLPRVAWACIRPF
jgi:hypothetical protein